jgi:hypothetical protein
MQWIWDVTNDSNYQLLRFELFGLGLGAIKKNLQYKCSN